MSSWKLAAVYSGIIIGSVVAGASANLSGKSMRTILTEDESARQEDLAEIANMPDDERSRFLAPLKKIVTTKNDDSMQAAAIEVLGVLGPDARPILKLAIVGGDLSEANKGLATETYRKIPRRDANSGKQAPSRQRSAKGFQNTDRGPISVTVVVKDDLHLNPVDNQPLPPATVTGTLVSCDKSEIRLKTSQGEFAGSWAQNQPIHIESVDGEPVTESLIQNFLLKCPTTPGVAYEKKNCRALKYIDEGVAENTGEPVYRGYRIVQKLDDGSFEVVGPGEQHAILRTTKHSFSSAGAITAALFAKVVGMKSVRLENGFSKKVPVMTESSECKTLAVEMANRGEGDPPY